MPKPDPVQPANDAARNLARLLLSTARFAALAVLDPATSTPALSRISIACDLHGAPMSLISSLSMHHGALVTNAAAAIMVGEPGPKGDPLTYPRLMVQGVAHLIPRGDPEYDALRDHWLAEHPKSRLYIDFADFGFVRFAVISAMLNGGFGKAFRLIPDDLA